MNNSPAVGRSIPAMRLRSVLFPLPLRPRMATNSPSAMAAVVSRSTTRVFVPSV